MQFNIGHPEIKSVRNKEPFAGEVNQEHHFDGNSVSAMNTGFNTSSNLNDNLE
jgi:hypothetical protein